MLNWILLWQVDSTYEPTLHGLESPGAQLRAAVRNGENDYCSNGASEIHKFTHTTNKVDAGFIEGPFSLPSAQPSFTDGETYQVYVATAITAEGVERRAVPYWSWAPCLICQRPRPPRCHHCALCKRCVLKRDHHCFFGRNCVGFNNQRFFIYFLVWSAIMTTWGTYLITPYVFRYVLPRYSYWDYVWPVNVARAVLGYLPLAYLHLTSVSLGVIVLLVFSVFMLVAHMNLVLRGVTSFEFDAKVKIIDTRSLTGRMRAVMGKNWGISLLLPGYTLSAPLDDPVYWPDIKIS
ncbi:palmitoyltransferase [Plakobranchus ocellatus]|uniref:Palmitoyltransferase n=1 Tax=Plakobranchus ocellatus TaxID=259542 RepID=A0AAV4AGN8_9GAST|nr:palmitoyltransferase [Plakobranchus ocellatus]